MMMTTIVVLGETKYRQQRQQQRETQRQAHTDVDELSKIRCHSHNLYPYQVNRGRGPLVPVWLLAIHSLTITFKEPY